MGNSLRCCLACVLPCGSFDLIRIVHLNGHIEEYSRPVTAGEVMAAHPSHVVSRPCSQGGARRILIVDPDSELERGCFYFLVPTSSVPEKKRKPSSQPQQKKVRSSPTLKPTSVPSSAGAGANKVTKDRGAGDSYLAEVLSEGKARCKRSRSVRATVWRPHLQIIPEEALE
ncbi:hypothetical protein CFC21_061925 [Triticum aestivum]|uniref:DUF4228 domain-containing protein n=3 Tax=Triticinae TaxID=1648030 RepID=A0A453IA58_AEGTS|nr:uncharacterized protein LOC109733456 [Aegilops tauschii subsp. strangulata]XP_044377927.1 uncharacterized protein LOC123099987 [Triticum aestivum]KAF7054202.1 hypothetical protein CFC21_061925 [Triticum aestivum]